MSYRQRRDYENCQRMIFPGVGEYDTPRLMPEDPKVDRWIPYNYAKTEIIQAYARKEYLKQLRKKGRSSRKAKS